MGLSFDEQLLELGKLEIQLASLQTKIQAKREALLASMNQEKLQKVESVFGKAILVERKTYDYSGFAAVVTAKNELQRQQGLVKEEAPFSVTTSVRFSPNIPMVEAGMPRKRRSFKARILKTVKAKV